MKTKSQNQLTNRKRLIPSFWVLQEAPIRGFFMCQNRLSRCVHQRIAFTLVELVVVVAIMAILMSLLMPALKRVQEQMKSIKCVAQLRQVASAYNLYANDNNGSLPITYRGTIISDYTWRSRLDAYLTAKPGWYGGWEGWTCPSRQVAQPVGTPGRGSIYTANRWVMPTNPGWEPYSLFSIKNPSTALASIDHIHYWSDANYGYNFGYGYGSSIDPRHSGGCNILFFDGHVSWFQVFDNGAEFYIPDTPQIVWDCRP